MLFRSINHVLQAIDPGQGIDPYKMLSVLPFSSDTRLTPGNRVHRKMFICVLDEVTYPSRAMLRHQCINYPEWKESISW
mgnify:CR=1 FL=1